MATFPPGFVWGAATAAYQVEGAVAEDGRGRSIWDTFSHTSGRIELGHTGDVACDHYHRYREDLAMLSRMGVGAYRFSVSWPRVQPGGRGPVNQKGMDFYRRLVDELGEAGIQPWLTLYHWDLPQELEDAGGWPERDTAERFADYAALVHAELGGGVHAWTTLNEPWCSSMLGYGDGSHAPGRTSGADALAAAHHLLLGHGMAVRAIRDAEPAAMVGIALNLCAISPAGESPADADAARRIDGLANRLFLDPVLAGRYPADVMADLAPVTDFGFVRDGDLETISAPLSMLGINYYSRHVVAPPPPPDVGCGGPPSSPPSSPSCSLFGGPPGGLSGGPPGSPHDGDWHLPSAWPGSERIRFVRRPGVARTAMDWAIDPQGLTETLVRVAREYRSPPLYVTENGAAFEDAIGSDGQVFDPDRIAYLAEHFRAARRAIDEGVPLHGYFVWSLLDNFEWAFGYGRRFGLTYVDYRTQRRTLKASGQWFSQVARRNGVPKL